MRSYLKPFWRRPQFSLATFMVVIALTSVPFAYVQYRRSWNTRRMEARRKLVQLGVQFASKSTNPYQYRWRTLIDSIFLEDGYQALHVHDGWGPSTGQPPSKFDSYPLQYFPEMETLALGPAPYVNDEMLGVVAVLPRLEYLSVSGVSGSFLQRLPSHSKIETLRIRGMASPCSLGLARLSSLAHLKELEIGGATNLSDECFRGVELPESIEELVLNDCRVGDQTLVRWLTNCKFKKLTLNVPMTRGISRALAGQTELEELDLQGAPLIDDDFEFLSRCKRLKILCLRDVPVCGDFLGKMTGLKNLEKLELIDTLTPPSRVRSFWLTVRRSQGLEANAAEVENEAQRAQ